MHAARPPITIVDRAGPLSLATGVLTHRTAGREDERRARRSQSPPRRSSPVRMAHETQPTARGQAENTDAMGRKRPETISCQHHLACRLR